MPSKRASFKVKNTSSTTIRRPPPPLHPYQSMTLIPAMGYEAQTHVQTSKYPSLKRTKVFTGLCYMLYIVTHNNDYRDGI